MMRKLSFLLGAVRVYLKYRVFQPLFQRPFLPTYMFLYATYVCNARCIMCGIWENPITGSNDEMTLEVFDRILSDPLFRKVAKIGINGGEFTLRADTPQMVQIAIKRLPKLREIGMISNGILTNRLLSQVTEISEICSRHNIALAVSISLHGLHEVEEKVYGIPGAFEQQCKSLDGLQELAGRGLLHTGVACVVLNENIDHLNELYDWCQPRGLPIHFTPAETRARFYNLNHENHFEPDENNKPRAARFFRTLANQKSLYNFKAYAYDAIAGLMESGRVRTMACEYREAGMILGEHGELYYCPHDEPLGNCRERSAHDLYFDTVNLRRRRKFLFRQKCPHCPPKDCSRVPMQIDIFKYLRFLFSNSSTHDTQSRPT